MLKGCTEKPYFLQPSTLFYTRDIKKVKKDSYPKKRISLSKILCVTFPSQRGEEIPSHMQTGKI